jgi:hypothetical protein
VPAAALTYSPSIRIFLGFDTQLLAAFKSQPPIVVASLSTLAIGYP